MISIGKTKKWYKGTNLTWFFKFCSLTAFLLPRSVHSKTVDPGRLSRTFYFVSSFLKTDPLCITNFTRSSSLTPFKGSPETAMTSA